MLLAIEDITERKRAQRLLQESHSHLESVVEHRTAAIRKLSTDMIHLRDDEQRKISRELHDSLGQYLSYAKMSLEALERPDPTEKETQVYSQLMNALDKCLTETRTIAHLLHPPLLDEIGFSSAAKVFVEGFSERSGIQVNLNIPPEMKRLPGTLELVLFRILQESLTNIHRHAHSQSVAIQVELGANQIALEVRDYGKGIPSERLERFRATGEGVGVGLSSMRERISELDGRFDIQSDSNGTMVRAVIPLPATVKETA
jgi:two-component system NarL family sensor kinase